LYEEKISNIYDNRSNNFLKFSLVLSQCSVLTLFLVHVILSCLVD
jgi:hypothetical protein